MTERILEPITTESLKQVFVAKFEDLILSGKISIGETLPSERELSAQLKVSRPVVHEGLIELSLRGLVSIRPRSGAIVNDFRKEGSIPLLLSLLNYHGTLDPKIQKDILEMRLLFENEMVRLCAKNRNSEQMQKLDDIIRQEELIDTVQYEEVAKLDYQFHQIIAAASGNFIYSLLLNSFREIYLHLSTLFFTNTEVCSVVFNTHKKIVDALRQQDMKEAVSLMTRLLNHGAEHLELIIQKNNLKNKI
ncbi:MAG: FadR family transcriptional regulator [Bacteroidetes bacterium]|nr:MAG: FadR family transcriptional regulator [Bacteroidota bacterium]